MRSRVNRIESRAGGVATAVAVALSAAPSAHADAWSSLRGALSESKPIFDTRLRFEGVAQDPVENDAEALTWRARLVMCAARRQPPYLTISTGQAAPRMTR